ncbi:MAG: MraY family glycosyltransferase [Candidatus Omnitrophota bacterium]
MQKLLIFLTAFLIVYFSTPLFKNLALKFNIVDRPGRRKIHKKVTALLGGGAVYFGVIITLFVNIAQLPFLPGIVIGATLIFVVGLFDDMRNLSAQLRLFVQLAAVVILMLFGTRLSFLPNNVLGYTGEILLTIIWIIGITNAVNYLDGIDGLAAGTTAVSAAFFAIIAYQTGQPGVCGISLALMAGCLAFLPHNFSKAKIFLGDAGSTFIGFILASIAVVGNWAEDNVVKITVPILILAIPIFDMIFTTIMRIKEEKVNTIVEWLKYGGRDHFHHRLIDLGLSHVETVGFICFVAGSFGINAIMVSNEKAVVGLLSIIQAGIIFAGIGVLMVIGKRRSHKG